MKMDDTGLLLSGDDKKVLVVGLILPTANGVGKQEPLLCKLASRSSCA